MQEDDSAEDTGADEERYQLADCRNAVDVFEGVPLDDKLASGHQRRRNGEVAECLDFLQCHLVKFANWALSVLDRGSPHLGDLPDSLVLSLFCPKWSLPSGRRDEDTQAYQ